MHAFREHGKSHPRILYWFRTPPSVRVGRAALDEDAIRSIEESNPGLAFDWTRMLKAAPAAEPAPPERRRDRRGSQRAGRPRERAAGARVAAAEAPPPAPPALAEETVAWAGEEGVRAAEADEVGEPPVEPPPPAVHRVEERIGREGLDRLRARHAELLARITECITDPVRLDELRTQAERLNPDTWVTDAEAQQGIANFDAAYEALRARLGRRRRRRRGGARRRRARLASGQPTPGPRGAAGPDDEDPAV